MLDFMGFLYFSLIPNFIQIVIVIVAIFGLCLYKHRLLIVVSNFCLKNIQPQVLVFRIYHLLDNKTTCVCYVISLDVIHSFSCVKSQEYCKYLESVLSHIISYVL